MSELRISFCDKVYKIVKQIPRGKVATYGQIAKISGKERAARAVGACMRNNPDIPKTPCHRVVAADGKLTGYSAGDGVETKWEMLEEEGVIFKGDKVDLKVSLWESK